MYAANTHLKPILGIDLHFVNLPFPFVPMPHPFIGLVLDPFDYIPFIGASVKIHGVPRGNTETQGIIITFMHIPFGAGFTIFPIIGHDSQNFFGDKKVSMEGAPMSGSGYILMTCNDIGIPLSLGFEKFKKKLIPIPSLYAPTSFCFPLQFGKPVFVGGPLSPYLNLMGFVHAFAFGCLLKVFGKIGGKLLRKLNGKLSAKGLSGKLKNYLCKLGLEPVDLVTGRVTFEHTDFELPGPIPIKWQRTWDSDASLKSPTGHGMQLSYNRYIQLWPGEGCLSMATADGRQVAFPLLYHGEEFYHPHEKILLRRKQNGHFILEDYNESMYYHFNNDVEQNTWRLSFIENYSGHRIQLHYNGRYLRAMTDSAGRQLLFELDKQQRIIAVEVKHRNISKKLVQYTYNEAGDLVNITDALNQSIHIEYNDHLMTKKTDKNGQNFYWEYDQKRRCVHTWGDGGILEGFIEYGNGYNTLTNSLGETHTYYYDENNLLIQETDHYGNHKYFEYTDDFELYREIDEEGNVTGYVYDDKARMIEKVLPNGSSTQYAYNDFNQLTLIINPDSSTETFGYDDMRRLRFINHPHGKIVALGYDEDGQVASIVENGRHRTEISYDEDYNISTIQLLEGASARWKYDALGRCIQSINTENEIRFLEYDDLGRITTLHLPDGNTMRLKYNGYEEVVQVKDKHATVQLEYTAMGNVAKRKLQNQEMQFLYDTEERLCSVINEAGRHYNLEYNKRGEIIGETGFDGLRTTIERSATGRTTKVNRPGGRSAQYEYDANGNIIRIEYHDGTWELFNYNKSNEMIEAVNEHSTVRLTRNKLGLIIMEEQDGYQVESRYDTWGNRIQLTSSLGADLTFQRNECSQVTHMRSQSWNAAINYNEAGNEIERILPGGLTSEWKYDQANRPAEHKISRRGLVQSWKKYTWDANDRLTNIFNALSQANTHFRFDAFGSLVFAQYANNSIVQKASDETGNLYETAAKTDRRYNAAGALLESPRYLFKYDEEGNLISKTDKSNQKKTRYGWYANGMLKKVVRPDGKTVQFTYDALGRRISKSFNGKLTRWVWHANVPLHEWTYDEQQKPTSMVNEWGEMVYDKEEPNPVNKVAGVEGITWLFEDDSFVPCARIENGKAWSILCHHDGTPQEVYDEEGKRVWEAVMDIYGRTSMIAGQKNFIPFRFQGQYEDEETGLCYNRFRYYNPEEGLYISRDPLSVVGGFNVYAYVDDPNVWIDPFGLSNTTIGDVAEDHFRAVLRKNGWNVLPDIKNGCQNGLDVVAQHPVTGKVYVFEVKANTSRLSKLQKNPVKYITDRLTEASTRGTICGKRCVPGAQRAAQQALDGIAEHGISRVVAKYHVSGSPLTAKLKAKGVGITRWVKC